jgi:uncharacterized protein YukE
MTSGAQHLFYVNHPQIISDVSVFRTSCTETEQTIVLGCYHPTDNGIDIYQVKDTRLNGIVQVTAAHEMLHAAYGRLSRSDKQKVDGWLLDYYNHGLHDSRILDTINAYKQTEPNDVVNEMHSVFGTEVGNLPANLESYYKLYFSDRAVIVGFADNYKNEFSTRITQINADDAKLADLKKQISQQEAALNSQLNQINGDRARLDSLKAQGNYSAYNAQVTNFNAEVEAYNSGVASLQSSIAYYNELVNERNQLAAEVRSLDQSIDTRLTTQSAQ